MGNFFLFTSFAKFYLVLTICLLVWYNYPHDVEKEISEPRGQELAQEHKYLVCKTRQADSKNLLSFLLPQSLFLTFLYSLSLYRVRYGLNPCKLEIWCIAAPKDYYSQFIFGTKAEYVIRRLVSDILGDQSFSSKKAFQLTCNP